MGVGDSPRGVVGGGNWKQLRPVWFVKQEFWKGRVLTKQHVLMGTAAKVGITTELLF